MPQNSPKLPPYWNYTSGFDFDHITAVDMSFCTSLRSFIQIGSPLAEKNDVMSIFKITDLRHLAFEGSNNRFFYKPIVMYNVLSGLTACGRLGVAARPACLFGTRPVARDQRHASHVAATPAD